MKDFAFSGSFNARWLSPDKVARQFVPMNQFDQLTRSEHSILLGPRGSGKTTLLKMLTPLAIETWRNELTDKYDLTLPRFETVYIPSDVRWSKEVEEVSKEFNEKETELIQRILVICNICVALVESFHSLTMKLSREDMEVEICKELINVWGLGTVVPTFYKVEQSIESLAIEVRSLVNKGSREELTRLIAESSAVFTAHAIDAPIQSCKTVSKILGYEYKKYGWALCFDELEIAPGWLRLEVLEALRSVTQGFYLKLTWYPILPSGLRYHPTALDDFEPIRLWHSHVADARRFCDDLTARFLRRTFNKNISTTHYFSQSILASDEKPRNDRNTYERGSEFYLAMRRLAKADPSFNQLLLQHDINPTDPYSPSISVRDKIFRKIKPIVMLRSVFLNSKTQKLRSRKAPTLYAGMEAVYAMSEGNPRWLLGLLTDMHTAWSVDPTYRDGQPNINYAIQSRVLSRTANRYAALISAIPTEEVVIVGHRYQSLSELLKDIGTSLSSNYFLGKRFYLDPYGSFRISDSSDEGTVKLIEKAMEIGSIVAVGSSQGDVPDKIRGTRCRLTFLMAPLYKLPLRNYQPIDLEKLLAGPAQRKQLTLFEKDDAAN